MAKRPDPRRLRSALTYTVSELARLCGVTDATVRAWLKDGLPALMTQRPTLITGDAAKAFLVARRIRERQPTQPNELFCMSCKAPRQAFEGMVDLIDTPGQAPRIQGFCAVCETLCSRIVRRADIPKLHQIFDVSSNPNKQPKGYPPPLLKPILQEDTPWPAK